MPFIWNNLNEYCYRDNSDSRDGVAIRPQPGLWDCKESEAQLPMCIYGVSVHRRVCDVNRMQILDVKMMF